MKKGSARRIAPLTAGVIVDKIRIGDVKRAVVAGADLLEVRIDTLGRRAPDELAPSLRSLRALAGRPVIITVRSKKEGGRFKISDAERLGLFTELAPYADYVDIELGSSGILKNVVELSRRLGKKLIISYHNFSKTPGRAELAGIIRKARRLRADVVKIACAANGTGELRRLASLLLEYDGLCVIGMGEYARASRVFFPALGSMISYGSVTRASAPGQMGVFELKKELRRFRILR